MAAPNTVKILEVFEVAPPSDSTVEFFLPFTYFDIDWFKFPATQSLYFFKLAETESASTYFHSKIVPTLKQALSQTLLHFLPLAGHLTWSSDRSSEPIFAYTPNDAISLTIAESSGDHHDFDLFLGNEVREAAKSHPYLPNLQVSDAKAALLALQITLFPNKGFSIGKASHHAMVDGTSASMFLKAWAHVCKHSCEKGKPAHILPPELTPCFDRTKIRDYFAFESAYLNQMWPSTTSPSSDLEPRSLKPSPCPSPPNLYRTTFRFTREDIKKLKEMVLCYHQLAAGPHPIEQLHLSTFVLTYAYVFVCMVKAIGGDPKRDAYISFVADCRNRLDPPLPPNYFGNCSVVQYSVTEAGVCMEENGVAIISEKLGDSIKGLEKDPFERAKGNMALMLGLGPEVHCTSVAGSTRMDLYKLDFGWGRVEKVEITSIEGTKAISMMPTMDEGGGVEIGVVLSKQEMEDFASHFYNGLNRERDMVTSDVKVNSDKYMKDIATQ